MTQTLQILTEAKSLIADPKKWIKGSFRRPDNCFCSLGAVYKAAGGLEEARPAIELLAGAMRKWTGDNYFNIICFNDDEDTTHDQVMKAFESAIAKAGA